MVKLFLKNSNLCDHNSPTSQTDRQTTCDRNTALCTKVHRAVKSPRGSKLMLFFRRLIQANRLKVNDNFHFNNIPCAHWLILFLFLSMATSVVIYTADTDFWPISINAVLTTVTEKTTASYIPPLIHRRLLSLSMISAPFVPLARSAAAAIIILPFFTPSSRSSPQTLMSSSSSLSISARHLILFVIPVP